MPKPRITYANLLSTIALFAVLGGVGYAAATIGAGDIKRNAVRARHIKEGAVKTAKLADGAVNSIKVGDDTLSGFDIAEPSLDLSDSNLFLSSGRVTRQQSPGSGGAFALLERGAVRVVGVCNNTAQGVVASIRVETTEANTAVVADSSAIGGIVAPDLDPPGSATIARAPAAGAAQGAVLDHATYSAVTPNDDVLHGDVLVGINLQGTTCIYSATGIQEPQGGPLP